MSMIPNINQSVDIDIKQLSKDLSEAVHQVKKIQVLVNSFIDAIVVRKNDETEKETQAIKATIKQVHTVRVELDKLGSKYSKLRLNNIHPVPLGNTGYVSLDPTEEQSGFYKQLLDCYTWLKNVDQDATNALEVLESKFKTEVPPLPSKNTSPTQSLIQLIGELKTIFPGMLFNETLIPSECCLTVKVGKVFVVNITFSGLVVSHVIVQSMIESFVLKHWQHSNYVVFKKLSDVFTCMVLHSNQNDPKELLRKMLNYIYSFREVFNKKCVVCNKYLSANSGNTPILPPLWKDLKSDKFYHLSCK